MAQTLSSLNGKEIQIIAMFQQGLDAKDIAKRLQFADYRQMANYMKMKGYVWDSENKNYEMAPAAAPISEQELPAQELRSALEPNGSGTEEPGDPDSNILLFLETHKKALMDLLSAHLPPSQLPRYVIPGVYTTKSVYMNHNIDLLIREFSEEKNISQRDIFEIALIDFFKKYGYQEQVKLILG
ncbi:hypothetical protein [Gordoniibacillus kamchatkensis]|uniref:hypothetical protein n=1 Tax=Gordoniibacillus kamchatkensis TaxID=1590651 RepID=UPI0006963F77|nr:hypothetical protein [Paenibacillus sp. VKM B-2647]